MIARLHEACTLPWGGLLEKSIKDGGCMYMAPRVRLVLHWRGWRAILTGGYASRDATWQALDAGRSRN